MSRSFTITEIKLDTRRRHEVVGELVYSAGNDQTTLTHRGLLTEAEQGGLDELLGKIAKRISEDIKPGIVELLTED